MAEKEVVPGRLVGGKFGGKGRYTITIDSPQANVEAYYFGLIGLLTDKSPFGVYYADDNGRVEKIRDIYTAGETSAYWGMVEQRKGTQQDKFQQLMISIGQMLKALFQLLRELRIMDERLEYYNKSNEGDKTAEVALKSIWVDLVEGGMKNAGSVLGLSTQVGFATLPDLFFTIHPETSEDVEREVDKLKDAFNRKVREVLSRKLKQYMIWKEKTYKELTTGYDFKLKYLRQHYQVIRTYLNWLRPYLKNVKRLQMKGATTDKDIMAAFDTSKIELEVLGIKDIYSIEVNPGNIEDKKFKTYFPCIRIRVEFVARPQLLYQQEGYQRGAIHTGKAKIIIDSFVTTEEDLEKYKESIEGEDLELLAAVDESILALKDELEYYLEKAGEKKKEEKEVKKKDNILTPLISMYNGFKEIFGLPTRAVSKRGKVPPGEKGAAEGAAKTDAYIIYKIFKKQNKMFTE